MRRAMLMEGVSEVQKERGEREKREKREIFKVHSFSLSYLLISRNFFYCHFYFAFWTTFHLIYVTYDVLYCFLYNSVVSFIHVHQYKLKNKKSIIIRKVHILNLIYNKACMRAKNGEHSNIGQNVFGKSLLCKIIICGSNFLVKN